jgi:hypothetical protein
MQRGKEEKNNLHLKKPVNIYCLICSYEVYGRSGLYWHGVRKIGLRLAWSTVNWVEICMGYGTLG